MGKHLLLVLFFWALLTISRACKPTPTPSDTDYIDYEDEIQKAQDARVVIKVLEGSRAAHGQFPHQVSLQVTHDNNRHFCGASIIHPKFLLTAAHCADGYQISNIRAVAGKHDLSARDGNREQIRYVTGLIKHEDYVHGDKTYANDIALLELNKPLNFDNQHVNLVRLWDSKWELPKMATVSGWGHTSSSGTLASSLMAAQIKVRDHGNCTRTFGRISRTVPSKTICAGGFRDACGGDSGGPLTCFNNVTNGHYLCGIVSWGVSCNDTANKQFPGVYTDVRKFENWIERNIGPRIFIAGVHLAYYTEFTSEVRVFMTTPSDSPWSLTYDWKNRKIYMGTAEKIYAVREDGNRAQIVFNSGDYGRTYGLAFDWITTNLYGVSDNGHVFVCRPDTYGKLGCWTLLTGQGLLRGIAVDPNNGKMYWTRWTYNDISSARMDGYGSYQVVKGLHGPAGITIDYADSRMFWTEREGNKISSSKLDGTDVRTIITLPTGTQPWGIAVYKNQIYWVNYGAGSLQRSSKSGENIDTAYTYKKGTGLVTTSRNFPTSRQNDCEGQYCAGICVLTASRWWSRNMHSCIE